MPKNCERLQVCLGTQTFCLRPFMVSKSSGLRAFSSPSPSASSSAAWRSSFEGRAAPRLIPAEAGRNLLRAQQLAAPLASARNQKRTPETLPEHSEPYTEDACQ